MRFLIDKIYDFRASQIQKLNDNADLTVGDVTSVNLTMLKGGAQVNVIPEEIVIVIDCRIPITVDIPTWEKTVNQWCKDAGEGVSVDCEFKPVHAPVTKLNDSNGYWMIFRKTFEELGLKMKTAIFPAGTDCFYLREVGVPCLGFSPMCDTPVLFHDHNEYLNMHVFLRGIEIYTKILNAIANVE